MAWNVHMMPARTISDKNANQRTDAAAPSEASGLPSISHAANIQYVATTNNGRIRPVTTNRICVSTRFTRTDRSAEIFVVSRNAASLSANAATATTPEISAAGLIMAILGYRSAATNFGTNQLISNGCMSIKSDATVRPRATRAMVRILLLASLASAVETERRNAQ